MRKFLIMTLMASAAIATQASAGGDQQRRRGGSGDSSSASGDESSSRPARPAWVRGEGGMSDDGARAPRAERHAPRAQAPAADDASSQPQQQQSPGGRRARGSVQHPSGDGTVQAQSQAGQPSSPFQQRLRDYRAKRDAGRAATATTTGSRAPGIAGGPRSGFLSGRVAAAPLGGRIQVASRPDKAWYAKWREERRYNWEQHRARYRDHYHLGSYWDPYGYDYRRWQIGWMMWPSYYQDSYWLNDPYSWRLPPVYGPYRWVRYWDDALLVNIYTGQVVDVLYNIFW